MRRRCSRSTRRRGKVTVKEGATLDYETTKFYNGQVRWTIQGLPASASVKIYLTDVEVGKPGAPTFSRRKFNNLQSAPALLVNWRPPATNGTTITSYEVQYRKKAAEGEEPAAWTAYSGYLSAIAYSTQLIDLEDGAIYQAQVRAVTSEEGAGPWSDTGEQRANRSPSLTALYIADQSCPWGQTLTSGFAQYFSDADGDSLTYSVSSQYPALLKTTKQETSFSWSCRNPGTSTLTYGARDDYGGYASRTATMIVTANPVRSVAEGSPAGTKVGLPVKGVPNGTETLTHTLHGEVTNAFVIDSATGQITVKTGATLHYDTKSSYTGQVKWTVGEAPQSVANLTINISNREPGKPGAPTVTRTEYSVPTNPGLDVTWTAAASHGTTITGYEAQYRKKAAQGKEAAAWTAYTGTLSETDTSLTLESVKAGTTYEVQVRAVSSDQGAGKWSDTGEGTANRPPTQTNTALADATRTWDTTGFAYVHNSFTDPDGDTLTYSASFDPPGIVRVSVTGSRLDPPTSIRRRRHSPTGPATHTAGTPPARRSSP